MVMRQVLKLHVGQEPSGSKLYFLSRFVSQQKTAGDGASESEESDDSWGKDSFLEFPDDSNKNLAQDVKSLSISDSKSRFHIIY